MNSTTQAPTETQEKTQEVKALRPNEMLVKPVVLDPAFEEPEEMISLVRSGGPYRLWAAINDRHEKGKDLPWFQHFWGAHEKARAPEYEKYFHSERFIQASREAFEAEVIIPSALLINMNAPMPGGHPHLDSPLFRGSRGFHFDLLLAMGHSGLFHRWAVPISSIICWFYEGLGGDFDYWPDGPQGMRKTLSPPLWNVGVVSDNEYMFHRVGGVGRESEHMKAGELNREALLQPNQQDDGWTIDNAGSRIAIPPESLRISVLWKALAFKDEAAYAEYVNGSNDLTLKRTLEIMSEDLDARGIGRLDIDAGYDDPTNRQLIHSTYKAPMLNDASRRKIL